MAFSTVELPIFKLIAALLWMYVVELRVALPITTCPSVDTLGGSRSRPIRIQLSAVIAVLATPSDRPMMILLSPDVSVLPAVFPRQILFEPVVVGLVEVLPKA